MRIALLPLELLLLLLFPWALAGVVTVGVTVAITGSIAGIGVSVPVGIGGVAAVGVAEVGVCCRSN